MKTYLNRFKWVFFSKTHMANVKQCIIYISMETKYLEEKNDCKTSNVHIALPFPVIT